MDLRITDDRSEVDFERLQTFLRDTIWQADVGPKTLKRSLDNSLCFSAFNGLEQIGFARAVTDRATFCWIDDVFVDPNYRGKGVAGGLIETILEHPELVSVATWFLSSSNPEARSVFSRYGFEPLGNERAAKLMALPKVQNEHYRT